MIVGITRDDVVMHMRVDHHQHQVIHLVGRIEPFDRGFDFANNLVHLCKSTGGQIGKRGHISMSNQHHRPLCGLRRTGKDRPVLIGLDQHFVAAELFICRVMGHIARSFLQN